MANMLMAFRNYADEASVAGGDWSAGLPLANLADRQLSRVARSSGCSPEATWFLVDLGRARPISFLALLRHNLSAGGQWRLRIGNAPDMAAPLYDSALHDIWPVIYPFGVGLWGEFVWGGKLSHSEAATYGIAGIHLLPEPVFARFLRVDLSDANNPAGYLQAGRLVVAPAYRPSVNLRFGWSLQQVDESRVSRSRGGQTYIDTVPLFRRLSFELGFLGKDEAYGYLYELHRTKGVSGDLMVMVDPEDGLHRHRETIYGRLSSVDPITNPDLGVYGLRLTVDELL